MTKSLRGIYNRPLFAGRSDVRRFGGSDVRTFGHSDIRKFRRWTFDVGRWTLDVGRWTLDVVDVRTLDVGTLGRWVVGRWSLDVARCTIDTLMMMDTLDALDGGRRSFTVDVRCWTFPC